jgi:hypothetical protein
MRISRKSCRKSVIVQPDDLQVGQCYAVFGLKNGARDPMQMTCMAFKLLAMNLPYIVGKLASDPVNQPLAFDVRFVSFMKVTDDFFRALQPETTA